MLLKPDWEDAQERFVAWWQGGHYRRGTFAITAPRATDLPPVEPPSDVRAFWTDPDWRIAAAERRFAATWFCGEAFPYFDTNLGPGSLALYLGSEAALAKDTVWYLPLGRTPAEVPALRFDPENRWWRASRRLVEEGVRRGRGRYLTSFPDLIENLDIVSSLVGPQDTLYALVDDPAGVKRLIGEVNELYFRCYDELYALLDGERLGSCFSAFQIWGPGKTAKVQCDASAMISPAMFAEFVAPALTEQLARLDFSAYHLDGPEAVKHLDALLGIPGLNAIQWTPGAGQPGPGDPRWWPMYRRIQAGGKGLLLLGVEYGQVEPLARHLGPDGVYIGAHAPSLDAAKDLLYRARTW